MMLGSAIEGGICWCVVALEVKDGGCSIDAAGASENVDGNSAGLCIWD